ncbi:hypothetical protein C2E23DRAFT_741778 [Lenzites betulinus]|nr:hypothetical protein C2E23DRAFT_741778 [Lenzites betulinus]
MQLTDDELRQYRLDPTPEVVQAAWDTIHTHESSIADLEARIQGLLNDVRDLRYDQAKHRAAIERSIGLITLARRLPEELLIRIFTLAIADGWTRGPVVVSHVCAGWRKAALAPQVWTHVYAECDDPRVLGRTRFWLGRARSAGLHPTIVASCRATDKQVAQLMALLVERSAQWKSLRVETDTLSLGLNSLVGVLYLCRHLCRHSFPELREVEVKTAALDAGSILNGATARVELLKSTFAAHRAPLLSSISYISTAVPLQPIFPAHIANLVLEIKESTHSSPLSAESLLTILEALPHLRALTLSMPCDYASEYIPTPTEDLGERAALLPALEALTLYGPTDMNGFLLHLRPPALRALRLRSLGDLGLCRHSIAPTLICFLCFWAPPLRLLELHDIDLTPKEMADMLRVLPDLRELRLHECAIGDATVRLLHGPEGLCPRLARVDFRWCGHLRGRALVDLVRSRRHDAGEGAQDVREETAADPIEEVGVINCCFVTEEDVLDLARMTVCRLVMREQDDYCRTCGCCENQRYRTRLRLRHMSELIEEGSNIKLVL